MTKEEIQKLIVEAEQHTRESKTIAGHGYHSEIAAALRSLSKENEELKEQMIGLRMEWFSPDQVAGLRKENEKLRAALIESVRCVEGKPTRSPFVAVEDWRGLLGMVPR